jgi:hypothetical protein
VRAMHFSDRLARHAVLAAGPSVKALPKIRRTRSPRNAGIARIGRTRKGVCTPPVHLGLVERAKSSVDARGRPRPSVRAIAVIDAFIAGHVTEIAEPTRPAEARVGARRTIAARAVRVRTAVSNRHANVLCAPRVERRVATRADAGAAGAIAVGCALVVGARVDVTAARSRPADAAAVQAPAILIHSAGAGIAAASRRSVVRRRSPVARRTRQCAGLRGGAVVLRGDRSLRCCVDVASRVRTVGIGGCLSRRSLIPSALARIRHQRDQGEGEAEGKRRKPPQSARWTGDRHRTGPLCGIVDHSNDRSEMSRSRFRAAFRRMAGP